MIWRILLLGLFGVLAESANIEGPSEFYIVSHYDSDLEGAWNYRILEVKSRWTRLVGSLHFDHTCEVVPSHLDRSSSRNQTA